MTFIHFLAAISLAFAIGAAALFGWHSAAWLYPAPPHIVEFHVEQTDHETLCTTPILDI